MQTCIRCQIEKELNSDNFYRRNSRKQGFDKVCKECRRISDKEKYEERKSKILEQKKKYYERKKEVIKERQRSYYHSSVES
jgi:late including ORF1, transcriptional activator of phage 31 late promoter, ORF3, ORF4, and ORF5 genes, complete cds